LELDLGLVVDIEHDRRLVISKSIEYRLVYKSRYNIDNKYIDVDRGECKISTIGITYLVSKCNGRTNTGISIDSCSNNGNSRSILVNEIESIVGMVITFIIVDIMVRRIECIIGSSMWDIGK
jgi:hypothetical protein